MMNDIFFSIIDVDDSEKKLYVSRPKVGMNGAFSPCDMTPDDIDYEMRSRPIEKLITI